MFEIIERAIADEAVEQAIKPELDKHQTKALAERVFASLVGSGWALPHHRTTKKSKR